MPWACGQPVAGLRRKDYAPSGVSKNKSAIILWPPAAGTNSSLYLIIFGNEEFGLSFRGDDFHAIKSLKIPQYGRVQSLNVSIAASIVMYEYIKQHGGAAEPPASGK